MKIFETTFSSTSEEPFKMNFQSTSEESFNTNFQSMVVGGVAELYEGEYEIVPTIDGETLQTKERYMEDDLIIKPIPFFDVSNNSGGTTVYIGKEID